jgi:hypothetical protein
LYRIDNTYVAKYWNGGVNGNKLFFADKWISTLAIFLMPLTNKEKQSEADIAGVEPDKIVSVVKGNLNLSIDI